MPKSLLTVAHIRFIKKNRLKLSGSDMAKKLKIEKGVVNRYMNKNGLSIPKKLVYEFRRKTILAKFDPNSEENVFIKENYMKFPIKRLSKMLDRAESFVFGRLKRLGLKVPDHIVEQRRIDSQWKAGTIPPNKGKKQKDYMSKEAIERTKATRFKKGNFPHSAIGFKNGDISIRQCHPNEGGRSYKYIRLGLGNWMPLHQHKWEQKHGKVKPGMCLWFKDGDSLNCNLKNIELITRGENARRNRQSFIQLPAELQATKKLINKINTTVHGKSKQLKHA